MHRSVGLLRQHELRASQQVAMKQSSQSLARIDEYSSTPPMRSQRTIEATNMFITRLLDECGLEIKLADEENMSNNDELTVRSTPVIIGKLVSSRLSFVSAGIES